MGNTCISRTLSVDVFEPSNNSDKLKLKSNSPKYFSQMTYETFTKNKSEATLQIDKEIFESSLEEEKSVLTEDKKTDPLDIKTDDTTSEEFKTLYPIELSKEDNEKKEYNAIDEFIKVLDVDDVDLSDSDDTDLGNLDL